MQNRLKVSVVIPCYNQAKFLDESVKSALNQSYEEIEIIIVNDGSTDNTLEVAQKICEQYPTIIQVVNQENKGLSEARNSGIRNANGTFILPLDADDLIDPNMIETCIEALIVHDADIVYTDYRRFGADDTVIFTGSSIQLYSLQFSNVFGATALYKRNVWERTGGYKANMKGGYEDWEFWLNAAKSGFNFFHIDETLFSYRVKETSMYMDALEKHRYLHSKIILNHPELFTPRQLHLAMSVIRKEEDSPPFYFYANEEIPTEKTSVLLIGGFTGQNNFGDILQLKETIRFHQTVTKFEPIVLCDLEFLDDVRHVERLKKQLGNTMIIFYAKINYDVCFLGLKKIKPVQIEWLHTYGGGFLNSYWLTWYTELAKTVFHFFSINYSLFSGQQVDIKSIQALKCFLDEFPPLLFGCRDKSSLDAVRTILPELTVYSFDDAFTAMIPIAGSIKLVKNSLTKTLFLHLNATEYVHHEGIAKALEEYKKTIQIFRERWEVFDIVLLVAFDDSRAATVRDSLNVLQTLEGTFRDIAIRIVYLSDMALYSHTDEAKSITLSVGEEVCMVTSSYHTAMLGMLLGIQVYLYTMNDYYRQKASGLGLNQTLPEIFEQQHDTYEQLTSFKQTRALWEEQLATIFKQRNPVIKKQNCFEIIVYERCSVFPLMLKSNYNDLTMRLRALERTERFMAEKLDWLENDYNLKENHIQNLEAIREQQQKELTMKQIHVNNLEALLANVQRETRISKIKKILKLR